MSQSEDRFCAEHPLPAPENLPSRLPESAQLWLSLPFSAEVKRWIVFGVHIPIPPDAPTFRRSNKIHPDHLPFARNEVQRMLRLRVILCPNFQPKCFTRLKTVPKGGTCPCKRLRLVMDGSTLDHRYKTPSLCLRAIPFLPFCVPQGWFMVSLDLSDYYLHFRLTEASTHWMGFRLEGKTYVFLATMFGFKISAYVSAKTSLELANLLRSCFPQSSSLVWVDDFLIAPWHSVLLRWSYFGWFLLVSLRPWLVLLVES